MGPQTFLIG